MAGESELERRSSLPLVVGAIVFVLILGLGFATWRIRIFYDEARELEKVGVIAHSWMWSDPQVNKELGTPSNASGFPEAIQNLPGHREAHVRYHVVGAKGSGDVDIWMKQFPGSSWTMAGAILTTADKRTVKIGSPPGQVLLGEKRD